jgi:hypothetical protein
MSKYFKVRFTLTQSVETEAVTEGESPDDVVDKIRNYYAGTADKIVVHEVTELEEKPTATPGKPSLRIVN